MNHLNPSIFSFPTLIYFGSGVSKNLPSWLKAEKLKCPLLVTDRGIAQLPFFQGIRRELQQGGWSVGVFSEFSGNPVESQVTQGVQAFRDHCADSILGIGGGSALDIAKAIALMVSHPGRLFDYEDGKPSALPINGDIPPWIAIPTTAGTGSEVGRSTVISDENTHVKRVIFSPRLLAKAVFADPDLTLDLPASVTAATGMDALTHCIEAYLAKSYHPICDGIALEGLSLAAGALKNAVQYSQNTGQSQVQRLESKSTLLMASIMGAIAFQKGLGVTHSCAHALSATTDLHHGLANGVMINHALEFNLSAAPDRFHKMAVAVGLKNPSGDAFISWLERLKKDIGIPNRLADALPAGLGKLTSENRAEFIGQVSELAFQDGCHLNNPRPCTLENFRQIFQKAF